MIRNKILKQEVKYHKRIKRNKILKNKKVFKKINKNF